MTRSLRMDREARDTSGNEIYELALTMDANDPASPGVLECRDEAIARIESSLNQ